MRVVFGLVTVLLQVFVPYRRLAPILKWLTLSLFVYVAAPFSVKVPWCQVAARPRAAASRGEPFWMMLVAVFGTTISPYLFFWQAAQEVEEMRLSRPQRRGGAHLAGAARGAPHAASTRWSA